MLDKVSRSWTHDNYPLLIRFEKFRKLRKIGFQCGPRGGCDGHSSASSVLALASLRPPLSIKFTIVKCRCAPLDFPHAAWEESMKFTPWKTHHGYTLESCCQGAINHRKKWPKVSVSSVLKAYICSCGNVERCLMLCSCVVTDRNRGGEASARPLWVLQLNTHLW